ncbi:MAG: DUF5615 family PIN-like protein [Chloroflexi bacterium]|nr:DUF5615 family PIN-like protein [Chloroflexota bacterium]
MSLRLYLDDCADSKRLWSALTGQPYYHQVVRPRDAELSGRDDAEHFAYARANSLIVVTRNPGDFLALHAQYPDHPGIFAIYQDNLPSDMSAIEIARAMQNIIEAGVPIVGAFHVLNRWRY